MKIVVSLGRSALLQRGQALEAEVQRRNVARAVASIAGLAQKHKLVVTHGGGPQVALLASQAESYRGVAPYPLDMLSAEVEGMIGYLIEQELRSRLPQHHVVTLVTQVEVNRNDPALKRPAFPVGPAYTPEEARQLANERGWKMVPAGTHWRRVVPAPEPLRVLELPAIRLLFNAGAIVVCAGAGGIPVTIAASGTVSGADAVIDKDLAAALLAHQLGADALLLLTDVDAVQENWGTERARAINETTPDELRKQAFPPETMGPKVEAVCRFVEAGGKLAGIGRREDAEQILEGLRGTVVRASDVSLDFMPGSWPPPESKG